MTNTSAKGIRMWNSISSSFCMMFNDVGTGTFWIPTHRIFIKQNRQKELFYHYSSFDRDICHMKLHSSILLDKYLMMSSIHWLIWFRIFCRNVPLFMCCLCRCCGNTSDGTISPRVWSMTQYLSGFWSFWRFFSGTMFPYLLELVYFLRMHIAYRSVRRPPITSTLT